MGRGRTASGPCLCGDLECGSCGPAQGNTRCPICKKWVSEGGCDDPERCDMIAMGDPDPREDDDE